MRRLTFILIIISISVLAHAQQKEGRITYERKVNMHKGLPADQENMKNMIPEFTVSKLQLDFSGEESIYKQIQEDEDIRDNAGQDGERMVIRFRGGENESYKNYRSRRLIELRELGPKKYIIEDSIRVFNWKLGEETKTIIGYTCKKAVTTNQQNQTVVAWYTEQLITPSGPEIFGGLPGMILELNIGDGQVAFTAVDIKTSTDKNIVKAPVNGKKITRDEFRKMMEQQFGRTPEGGGPMIRVMRN